MGRIFLRMPATTHPEACLLCDVFVLQCAIQTVVRNRLCVCTKLGAVALVGLALSAIVYMRVKTPES